MFEGVADVRWMDNGTCASLEDASVMFPTGTVSTEALRACLTCPVFSRCRAYTDEIEAGMPRDDLAGFVAGETVAQRIARRREAARTTELAEAVPA